MLHFLLIPKYPTPAQLWAILAETRRLRRRFQHEGLNYSSFYGITNKKDLEKHLISFRLRERIVESLLTRFKKKNPK